MHLLLFVIVGLLGFVPPSAEAHVKWFVNSETLALPTEEFYTLSSPEVWIWMAVTGGVLIIAWLLNRHLRPHKNLLHVIEKNRQRIKYLSQMTFGIFLMNAGIRGIFFIPNLPLEGVSGMVIQYVQIAIGAMLISTWGQVYAAGAVGVLYGYLLLSHGVVAGMENIIVIALAVFFTISHAPKSSLRQVIYPYRFLIVRIGTGLSLVVLAFTEKFFAPHLSLAFLSIYNWNFMQPIIFWYSDKLFVLSAGFMEMIFGLLLILGFCTRLTTLAVTGFFLLSVAMMGVSQNEWEVEHMVIYSAVVLLITFGNGLRTYRTN